MILALDAWLLPAIAASSSSYLVCLLWERFRPASAPSGLTAGFLSSLSFIMGAVCAYFREKIMGASPESNIVIMFVVGASTTYFWLLLRRYWPGTKDYGGSA